MADTRVLSNRRVTWGIGPDVNIPNWDAPTLAQAQSLTNLSEAVKIEGTEFNLEASDQTDDRSFTDEAGAQSRSYDQFGGNIEAFTPKPEDTTSILRTARNTLGTPRTKLAVLQRFVPLNSTALAAGDEVSIFHVITDARAHHRSETSYSYGTNLVPRDDCILNYILPSASPTSPVVTPATASLAPDAVQRLKVAYEGRNITIGATYSSDDTSVAEVTPHGCIIAKAAGACTISVSYPGAGVADTVEVTVA